MSRRNCHEGQTYSSLNHIVRERVAQELLKLERVSQLLNHVAFDIIRGGTNALLDDIGAELLAGEDIDVAEEATAKRLREGRLTEVQDVLNNVVAKGILNKSKSIGSNVLHKLTLLVSGSMIDAALQDTAAVAMSADGDAVLSDSIEDELRVFRGEVVEAFLNDMVAVEVLNEGNNLELECLDDLVDLGHVSSGRSS